MAKIYLDVIETNWGVANRFPDNTIEVNKHLKDYPHLYRPIMSHEKNHTNDTFSWKDLKHDINSDHKIKQMDLLAFMIRHPKALSQLLPFYYSRKRGFVIDINQCVVYAIGLILLGSVILASWIYL